MNVIELNDCQFSYNPHTPLTINISRFEIKQSEKVFLHGPSGHGKSTLLNLIAGVLAPTKGDLWVLGHNLKDLSASKRDRLRGENIGYIFQIFNLIPYLDIKENIILPCLINSKRSREDFEKQAEELINALGLREHAHKKVTDLSIGQQQRVAAARALIGEPKLVIADEPTSALDEKNTQEFMQLLIGLCEKRGFTLLFVSHDERLRNYFSRSVSLSEINRHD